MIIARLKRFRCAYMGRIVDNFEFDIPNFGQCFQFWLSESLMDLY